MRCRNLFLAILIALSLLFHGCSQPITYVQAYYDRTLKASEISWIKIGRVYYEDYASVLGLEVMFEGLPQEVYTSSGFKMFAFPAGDRTFQVRYHRSSASGVSYTEWVEITKSLEGGKCYEINDTVQDVGGFFSLAPDRHVFKIEESSCSWTFRKCPRVELYRLGGYKAMPTLELIKSYDVDDDVFSQLRSKNSNSVTIRCEFIRQLYEELE